MDERKMAQASAQPMSAMGMGPVNVGYAANPATGNVPVRAPHPEGIRGENYVTMETLCSLYEVNNRIFGYLTGSATPDMPYPNPSGGVERAMTITDLSNTVLQQARAIRDHLQG